MVVYGKSSNPTDCEERQKTLNWNLKLVRQGNLATYAVENKYDFLKSENALDVLFIIFFNKNQLWEILRLSCSSNLT